MHDREIYLLICPYIKDEETEVCQLKSHRELVDKWGIKVS